MYRRNGDELEAVAVDFAVASWGSARCVYDKTCGPGLDMDDDLGDAFAKSFFSSNLTAPVYRQRLQKLLLFPSLSTMDFRANEFKDVYRFFPMADPLTDKEHNDFASTLVQNLKDVMTTEHAKQQMEAIRTKMTQTFTVSGPQTKVGLLVDFVKTRKGILRTAGEAKQWTLALPDQQSSFYATALQDNSEKAWLHSTLSWQDKGKAVGQSLANHALAGVLATTRVAGGVENKTAAIKNELMLVKKNKEWHCHEDITADGKVYPTKYTSVTDNKNKKKGVESQRLLRERR